MRLAASILATARLPTRSRRVFRPSSRARPCLPPFSARAKLLPRSGPCAVSRSALRNRPGAGACWGQKRGLRAKSLGLAPLGD
eukprot:12088409-Alexandrium_andersonii.AAC.1